MSIAPEVQLWQNMPLFKDLTSDEIAKISQILHFKTLPTEANLIMAEQPGEVVFIIVRGSIKIQAEQPDGSFVILALMGPGEVVGEMSLLDQGYRSATVITMEPTTVGWMSRTNFSLYLHSMPRLTLNLSRILSHRLRLANEQTKALATQDVYGRVARQLLAFAHQYCKHNPSEPVLIPFRLTQSDLAGLVGATRPRVNQALMMLRQQHFIELDHNYHIIVCNPVGLARRCGFN
jgi:CRP/FNR family cyclic AMP-dependent transcriptional regulator